MITKQFYVSPECETTVFLEKITVLTGSPDGSLNPLMDNTDTIDWLI